jgi:hypothetical protein
LLEERRLDPDRPTVGSYRRTTDFRISPTDPDASPMRTGAGTALGYHDHYVVDGDKRRIILAALVTPADVIQRFLSQAITKGRAWGAMMRISYSGSAASGATRGS